MKKLAALVCLSAGLFCLFPDDAQAQKRKGNTYSQMGQNNSDILYQFNLVDTTKDGSLIEDSDNSKEDIGLFYGAIEQYKSSLEGSVIGIACSKRIADIFGDPETWTPKLKNSNCGRAIENSNLDALGIYYIDPITQFPILLTGDEVDGLPNIGSIPIGDGYLITQLIDDNTIAYKIFKAGENQLLQEYKLNIYDLDPDYQRRFNKIKAINNLQYILDENLFSKFQIVVTGNNAVTERILLQNTFESNTTSIPESGSTPNVLATIMLGAILFTKKAQTIK